MAERSFSGAIPDMTSMLFLLPAALSLALRWLMSGTDMNDGARIRMCPLS